MGSYFRSSSMENWKTVEKATKYEVSNYGRIRNSAGRIMKAGLDKYGYPRIHLIRDDGSNYYVTVHRLVAIAWVTGYRPNLQVNHKDGVKVNNNASNLEWVTVRENINHSYKHLLNSNTTPAVLVDVMTDEVMEFISLKALGKYLGIYPSVLVPLILSSHSNPIFDRYVIEVVNEVALDDRANTVNFGRLIHVFDELTQSTTTYPSVMMAAYKTGIRSLSNLTTGCVSRVAGYHVSFDARLLPSSIQVDPTSVIYERERYLKTPYVKRDHTYCLYDYYTKVEHRFVDLDKAVEFINFMEYGKAVTAKDLSQALGDGHRKGRTGLIRGFGIKSSRHAYEWYPYWEEVIITNQLNTHAVPVYLINTPNGVFRAVGKEELCRILGYRSDKPVTYVPIETIVKSCNVPNITITRLNKPIV